MSIKERTLHELEQKIEEIEDVIHSRGIGSSYLNKAEKIQRDINLGVVIGGATALLGVGAWMMMKDD